MRLPDFSKALNKGGFFYRCPTHLEEADRALQQSDIVEAIKGSRRTKAHEKIEYTPESMNSHILPGTVLIRKMTQEVREAYFRNLLKIRPNIYMIRVSLGEYSSLREVSGKYVSNIGSRNPISYKKIAESIAELFERYNIVEFVYTVENASAGRFVSKAYAWEADDAEYNSDENFKPFLEFEYITP